MSNVITLVKLAMDLWLPIVLIAELILYSTMEAAVAQQIHLILKQIVLVVMKAAELAKVLLPKIASTASQQQPLGRMENAIALRAYSWII